MEQEILTEIYMLLREIRNELHSMNAKPEPIKKVNLEFRADVNEICRSIKSRGSMNG